MKLPLYQLDAFTDHVFGGNPAAVVPLEEWLPDATLQAIAGENNLSETAFIVRRAGSDDYDLRWFTPKLEVDLCGHATLASAWVVLHRLDRERDEVVFHTRSGPLAVKRRDDLFEMDLPSQPGTPLADPSAHVAALGAEPHEVLRSVSYDMAVFDTAQEVRRLEPDERALLALEPLGVIATAPGDATDAVDFVSRFFAPRAGIFEDPVTGSAHCVSTPYWAERLGKDVLRARQISERVGDLFCEQRGDRVAIAGAARLYLEGSVAT
jgi:PhzF family phenazine biosynthesis protein